MFIHKQVVRRLYRMALSGLLMLGILTPFSFVTANHTTFPQSFSQRGPGSPFPLDPDISVNDVTVIEGDSGSKDAVFTVALSYASTEIVTVEYATADGIATAGTDYTAIFTSTLIFSAGTMTRTIPVQVLGDALDEFDETFFVTLFNPTNAVITDDVGVGTIIDDDAMPTLSIGDVAVSEGDSGTTDALFTVSLSVPSGRAVVVKAATADDTATAGMDYTAIPSRTLVLNPGAISETLSVEVAGDTFYEANETFVVNLSEAQHAIVVDDQGKGTIIDDDPFIPAIIYGTVFDDINKNGVRETGEAGIPGVTVYLSPNNAFLDQARARRDGGQSTVTDEDGSYAFSVTDKGLHTVSEIDPLNYTSTTPNTHQVDVSLGKNYQVDFGDVADGSWTCSPDIYEPDDTAGQAKTIRVNEIQTHQFCDDATDWVSFGARANTPYTITATADGQRADPLLTLVGTDGRTVLMTSGARRPSTGAAASIVWRAPAGGTYYLQVTNRTWVTGSDTTYGLLIAGPEERFIYIPRLARD